MRILFAGEAKELGEGLAREFEKEGTQFQVEADPERAHKAALLGRADLLLLALPEGDPRAVSLLESLRQGRPGMPILVLVGPEQDREQALAWRLGVQEVVKLPADPEALALRLRRLVERSFHSVETHGHPSLWSEATREVYQALRRAALSPAPLLLTGETGTGKEMAARTVHELSARRKGPFVAVNCPGLAATLMESELFGHEKGAYTHATATRLGRFEAAAGGTLLLDEVSELESGLQAKLLRVLQEQTFERVGSNQVRRADVRIIATSNRDLDQEVASGRFRADLYHRLNVLSVRLPALRERCSEIVLFLRAFAGERGISISAPVERLLEVHAWPGNVRELENLVARLAVDHPGGLIESGHLPAGLREGLRSEERLGGPTGGPKLLRTLHEVRAEAEREAIRQALEASGGCKSEAARRLGVSRATLRALLRKCGEPRPRLVRVAGE